MVKFQLFNTFFYILFSFIFHISRASSLKSREKKKTSYFHQRENNHYSMFQSDQKSPRKPNVALIFLCLLLQGKLHINRPYYKGKLDKWCLEPKPKQR